MNISRGGDWKMKPFVDGPTFYTSNPPRRFWRLMQWLCFGFRWERE